MYEDIKTAALYVRYSSANQTEQSIEGQTRVCQEFCQRHGIIITDVYADRATSASKDIEKRIGFLRMIKDSEKHKFDAVVVYKLDRFARSRYDMATYKFRLKKNGVVLISATENISQDPEGIILESVLEGMAEFYSAELGQKIDRGMRESAMKNQYIGGTPPLGYKIVDKKYVIDETTAPIIREAFQLFNEGTSIAEICRMFNAKGYRTSLGKKFGRSSFAKIFRNEKYIGIYTFHDYRAEDVIPAIIDKDTWAITQKKLKDLKPAGTYKAAQVYLLTGKIFCGHCGSRMNAGKNSNRYGADYSYYACRGKKTGIEDCKEKNVRKEWIEKTVLDDALSMLTDEMIEQIADTAMQQNDIELEQVTDIPAIRSRLAEIRTSLTNLTKSVEAGFAPETIINRMIELEYEEKVLEKQLKDEERYIIKLDKPHIIFWLESLRDGDIDDPEYQKQLIDLFINKVTVTDSETPGEFTVQISYNLSAPDKIIVGFNTPTSRSGVKSDIFVHTVQLSYRPCVMIV